MLLSPGSSLGGARPKSCVIDNNEMLWIAKLPGRYDDVDIGAWEYVTYLLAIDKVMLKKLKIKCWQV